MNHLRLELETPYQVTPLPLSNGQAVHRIAISIDGDEARVTMDPNTCGLDPFGDTTICTRIAYRTFEAKLSLLENRDGKRFRGFLRRHADEGSCIWPERHWWASGFCGSDWRCSARMSASDWVLALRSSCGSWRRW